MKKLFLISVLCVGLLLFSGVASATVFTDIQNLNVTIGEGPYAQLLIGDTYSYTHDTPSDFEVPWDVVNSATLEISGYFINDNNDTVEVSGYSVGTLNEGGYYGLDWSWSGWTWVNTPSTSTFDISSTFASWSAGAPLDVSITAHGDLGDGILELHTSTFTLDYDNGSAPVPEPTTLLLSGLGLLGMGAYIRRKRSKK